MSRLTSVHTTGLCAEAIGGTLTRALADYRLGPTEQAEIGSAA